MGLRDDAALASIESAVSAEIVVDGRRYVNFGGSSYLGLSANATILETGARALQAYGAGAPIRRQNGLITQPHADVESAAASYFGSPAAVYLPSGYFFGLVALGALREQYTTVFIDEFAHHCLHDAVAASRLQSYTFRHLDPDDLASQLTLHVSAADRPLIVTDGLFSTFGKIAPLDRLAALAAAYGGRLIVDESHSFGVLGGTGRGAFEHHGLDADCVLIGGSLAKAFGTCGGIIATSESQAAAMRATPAAIGASPGLPAAAAMCAQSLRYVAEHPEILQRLRRNVRHVKDGLRRLGLEINDNDAPIAAFVAGSAESMHKLRNELRVAGIFVYHSRYIGAGSTGVIRCGIFADHTAEHIDYLLQVLGRLL